FEIPNVSTSRVKVEKNRQPFYPARSRREPGAYPGVNSRHEAMIPWMGGHTQDNLEMSVSPQHGYIFGLGEETREPGGNP
ncbi:hypothetical protein AMELA_G00246610, partial [Ameiurus melas]